jgi:hypothetical protein
MDLRRCIGVNGAARVSDEEAKNRRSRDGALIGESTCRRASHVILEV